MTIFFAINYVLFNHCKYCQRHHNVRHLCSVATFENYYFTTVRKVLIEVRSVYKFHKVVDLTHVKTSTRFLVVTSVVVPGASFLESPGNLVGPVIKVIFSSAVSKNEEVHTPETSCIKRTSVHIKNM